MTVQVIDPRIPPPARPTTLAPRSPSLAGGRILLFDNGKLASTYGEYRAVFDVLADVLTERFADLTILRHTDDLLRGTASRLTELADDLAGQHLAGAVFALADWGVSQPTAITAALLEARGVPTTVVATEIGARHVLASATRLVPGLPVTAVHALRSADYPCIVEETRRLLDGDGTGPGILGGLVTPAARLEDVFAGRDVAAPAPADPTGLLTVDGADPSLAFTDLMRDSGLGDGLPLLAPTRHRVAEFLAATGVDEAHEIWPAIPPRDTPVTAREVAAVAVAAGCRPRWAPVVLAAYRAMAAPEFRLFQAAITTHPGGTLVLVSGPDSARLGFASGRGALGPGFDANATTGRAVALGCSFLLGAVPGGADLTAQGSPAEFSYCTAENLEESPWPGLSAALGHDAATTVTVLKCEGPHNVLDQQSTEPAELLGTVASTMATLGSNAAYVAGAETVLLLNPEHARLLAAAGWSRRDVQEFLFDAARNPRERLRDRGIEPIWPAWFDGVARVPVLPSPADLLVTVTGGAGPASQVALPWGYSRAVTVPVG